jgi:hypothetical protein
VGRTTTHEILKVFGASQKIFFREISNLEEIDKVLKEFLEFRIESNMRSDDIFKIRCKALVFGIFDINYGLGCYFLCGDRLVLSTLPASRRQCAASSISTMCADRVRT